MAARRTRPDGFALAAVTPVGCVDAGIAIAASRAGEIGILDLTGEHAPEVLRAALDALAEHARPGRYGVRVDPTMAAVLGSTLPAGVRWVILSGGARADVARALAALTDSGVTVLVEIVDVVEAESAAAAGATGLVARGSETGGRVGEETAFVLTQRVARPGRTVWVQGGISPHTIAACRLAGAAGAVLDAQLLLTRESPLGPEIRGVIARMDGSETSVIGADGGRWRVFDRPGLPSIAALREVEEDPVSLRRAVLERSRWDSPEHDILCLGQDASFAAELAARYGTVGGVLTGLRTALEHRATIAAAGRPLAEGALLAQRHGTRFPLVQGPMTRVSDHPGFADAVATAGALPFIALALMKPREVDSLLAEVADRLHGRPWGVGILGFVPLEVREAQLEVVARHRPPYALVAGGRPDQAAWLDERGIATYLHAPSPALLASFAQAGARRFVLEGRECGGHVGPRSSFVLWSQAVDALLRTLDDEKLADCNLLLAGGIHDARSAAMAVSVAAPLLERGAAVGVLMGTAYVLTEEAVSTGAIVEGFQSEALRCEQTVLLESGPGHATRCAPTPFAEYFASERRRLRAAGTPPDEVHDGLERLSLGRLRVAAKGLERPDPHAAVQRVDAVAQADRGLYMLGQVVALRRSPTSARALHENVSAGGTRVLRDAARAERRPTIRPRPADAAIVGMACILPQAPEVRTFWRNILGRVDAITEVPSDRFDWRHYYEPAGEGADAVTSRWGGFIDEVLFDPVRWGMPPRSLRSIEPMQLLALEVAAAALGDAGYAEREFPRERTSVILGIGGGLADLGANYALRAGLPSLVEDVPPLVTDQLPVWTEDSFAGILLNVAAGRVANRLDLGGANYTVDAACASSLAAIQLATRELEAGSSDMVVAGGADTVQNPFGYLCFSKTRALSRSGRCRPFDAAADGIAISEGLAMVVLKRLTDAERDGDRVYAVVKAVGGSSDGRAKGLTAPRPEGQRRALDRAYSKAGVSPATVGLVEAHGTGTAAGDRAEARTLAAAFEAAGAMPHACALGSVKSMIGHTKCTAGVAGLVKAALALHHKVLPPTINVERPNPAIGGDESPFYVNTETRPWVHAASHPRRAGVSAFGFGGTNFHCVLEEYADTYIPSDGPSPLREWPAELYVLSDVGQARRVGAALQAGAAPEPACLAAALWRAARGVPGPRIAVLAADLAELAERLQAASAGAVGNGVVRSDDPLGPHGEVALLFPGQGSQHCDMLRDLAVAFPTVRASFERADRVLGEPLSRRVFPPPRFSADERERCEAALRNTAVAQPALGATELALHELLQQLGLSAAMTGGHSYGELVALCAAGAIGGDDLLRLSAARGDAMRRAVPGDPGTMAAVSAGADRVTEFIGSAGDVVVANLNSARQTVIAGPTLAVEDAVVRLKASGIGATKLPVACAFHTPLMAPGREIFAAALEDASWQRPRVPVFSNLTARPHTERIASALADHLVRPVRFADEVEAMYDAGARIFVEMGPRDVLTRLVRDILDGRPHFAVPIQRPGRHGLVALLEALAELVTQGVPVDLECLWSNRAEHVDLDALLAPSHPSAPPPTAWLVDGGRARPATEKPLPRERTSLRVPAEERVAPTSGSNSVMVRFEALMADFVTDQRRALLAALGQDEALVRTTESHGPSSQPPDPIAVATPPPCLVPVARPVGSPVGPALVEQGDVVLIATDGVGVAERLARRLTALGARPVVLGSPDLADSASIDAAVATVRARFERIRVVVDLRPLGCVKDLLALGEAEGRRHVGDLTIGLVKLVQATADDLRGTPQGTVIAATALGGTFGIGELPASSLDPAHGAVAGVVKSIGVEWPEVAAKIVDFDPADASEVIASGLVEELSAHDGHGEIGRLAGQRLRISVQAAPLEPAPGTPALHGDAVVLLTGGARGITAEVAKALAGRFRCTLVLVGRTALPAQDTDPWSTIHDVPGLRRAVAASLTNGGPPEPARVEASVRDVLHRREIRSTLAAITAAGGRAEYRQADAAHPGDLGAVVAEVYARHGRLDGVVHGAGVIEDCSLTRKTEDSAARVLDAKVTGALTLARAVRWEDLGFFVCFGSIAGRFGNAGQADYAAANEVLSKLAAELARRHAARVITVAWGPWGGSGMVSPEVLDRFRDRGVTPIDSTAGSAALIAELECRAKGPTEILIGDGPWAHGTAPGRSAPTVLRPEDPLLDNHRLDGQPVLPAALALELLAAAAGEGPGPLQVEDLQVLGGVALDDGPLTVEVTPSPDGFVELCTTPTGRRHYRARVSNGRNNGGAGHVPGPLASRVFPFSAEELYARWLWHGPALHAIASVEACDVSGIDATLIASGTVWKLDPVVVDGVFQLAIVWARFNLGSTSLPARVARLEGSLCLPQGTPVHCRLRLSARAKDSRLDGHAVVLSADGTPLITVDGLEFACSRQLNRLGPSVAEGVGS